MSQEPEINIESSDESTVENDVDDEVDDDIDEEKGEKQDYKHDLKSKTIVEPFNYEPDEYEYDVVDMLPPFCKYFLIEW